MYKIDKTESLETKLEGCPSIYIEAAAAAGKTTAVEMLVKKHPEIRAYTYPMDEAESMETVKDSIHTLLAENKKDAIWIVFENINTTLDPSMEAYMVSLVRSLPKNWKVLFVSRMQPSGALLDLLWKGQMDIITQESLRLTLKDVHKLASQYNTSLQLKSLYKVTGGWAGCVDIMLRMSKRAHVEKQQDMGKLTAEDLRGRYEVDAYIKREILDTLSPQEKEVVAKAMTCPWISRQLCQELWQMEDVATILEGLGRRGILIAHGKWGQYRLAPLFNTYHEAEFPWKVKGHTTGKLLSQEEAKTMADWYERYGYLKEALWCMKASDDREKYYQMLISHCGQIPFINVAYEEVLRYNENLPQLHYLRGMWCHKYGDYEGMTAAAKAIGKEHPELYLNLTFANPTVSLDEWLVDVDKLTKKRDKQGAALKFSLFHILGDKHSYLCGLRDLTGLFACSKKDENKKANIWKSAFGPKEWQAYCLARYDYYLETDREKQLCEEDEAILSQVTDSAYISSQEPADWSHSLVGLYLLCRRQAIAGSEERKMQILQLKDSLHLLGDTVCTNHADAILSLYGLVLDNPEQLSRWLMAMEGKTEAEMTGTEMLCLVKGYMLLQQYEKAEAPLQKILLSLSKYRMSYLYAEALLQQAIINWHNELRGQALKNIIESFMIASTGRYVRIYTDYGKLGFEVVKSYVEWMQNNASGGWNTKKKYNYGNVLRMPIEDYLEAILRKSKRSTTKETLPKEPVVEERLTMMETIVLQDISKGLTNAEICEEQNLKLSTVKTHLYNMYKKLGVSSRVQAIIKGKEMGLVK